MRSMTEYQLYKGVNYIQKYFIMHYKYTAFTWDKAIHHIEYMWCDNSVAWERVYEIIRACANIFEVQTARVWDCILLSDCCAGIVTQSDAKTSMRCMRACERNSNIYICLCVWCACDTDLSDTLVSIVYNKKLLSTVIAMLAWYLRSY